ncbi:unnamed protein product, partial [Rotaria magnacalcarata]
LLKVRKAKIASGSASAGKVVKRVARQVEVKKSSWSLASLLKNVAKYFPGESTNAVTKKRTKRTHPKKKSVKLATTAKATTTAAKK